MAKTQALIFDFDGTIALSEPVHMLAWEQMALDEDFILPHGFLESGIGRTDHQLCIELSAAIGGKFSVAELLKMKRSYYQNLAASKSVLVPHADLAIKKLSTMFPIAIATSACLDDIMPALKMYDLTSHFRTMLTVDDVKRAKPDPEIYLAAAARLKVDPKNCWAFEDSFPGLAAANAAGMKVCGMLTTYTRAQMPKVDHAIRDFSDLDGLIKVLGK